MQMAVYRLIVERSMPIFPDLKHKTVVVMGAGKSGIAAVSMLKRLGAHPVLFDENTKIKKEQIEINLPKEEFEFYTGELPEKIMAKTALLVMSPGVPSDTSFVDWFRKAGIPVWGEIELAYRYAKGDLIAITGTNGKTTTTSLIGKILKDYFDHVFVVGNIGYPYTASALETKAGDVTVAEISSFQLETIQEFHPKISVILNITPDHLDRHHTMENYVVCKEAIATNQTKSDLCVLNYEDAYTRKFAENCPAEVLFFSSATRLERGIYLDGEGIFHADGRTVRHLMDLHETSLLGIHNAENIMAAMAVAMAYGVPEQSILQSVREFQAVEHRIEYVATIRGVAYYNDSKGTNPDAAIRAIRAMTRKTVLIGGGYDKENTFDQWMESFAGKVTWLILLGQTKEKIAACARAHGFENIIMTNSLEEAVAQAAGKAKEGEAVLLSPACASWGMFPNYEVRGRRFKELVMNLEEERSRLQNAEKTSF